jgi:predicted nucleotidyltransferase
MTAPFSIDDIIASPCKVGILRALVVRRGFRATGRAIARLIGFSAPSTHEALKALHAGNILTLEAVGRQHIYSLNEDDRLVRKLIRPMFEAEGGLKDEIRGFIVKEMEHSSIRKAVAAVYLYGSLQKGAAVQGSDVDIAVVVHRAAQVERVAEAFVATIAPRFRAYFGAQLDPYVKSAGEFRDLLKKQRPPVSTLVRSYSVLVGREPLEV